MRARVTWAALLLAMSGFATASAAPYFDVAVCGAPDGGRAGADADSWAVLRARLSECLVLGRAPGDAPLLAVRLEPDGGASAASSSAPVRPEVLACIRTELAEAHARGESTLTDATGEMLVVTHEAGQVSPPDAGAPGAEVALALMSQVRDSFPHWCDCFRGMPPDSYPMKVAVDVAVQPTVSRESVRPAFVDASTLGAEDPLGVSRCLVPHIRAMSDPMPTADVKIHLIVPLVSSLADGVRAGTSLRLRFIQLELIKSRLEEKFDRTLQTATKLDGELTRRIAEYNAAIGAPARSHDDAATRRVQALAQSLQQMQPICDSLAHVDRELLQQGERLVAWERSSRETLRAEVERAPEWAATRSAVDAELGAATVSLDNVRQRADGHTQQCEALKALASNPVAHERRIERRPPPRQKPADVQELERELQRDIQAHDQRTRKGATSP